MDRFIPFFDDVKDEPHFAALRACPEWNAIYALMRPGYWHVTSLEGWELIRTSGAIRPNTGGRYNKRFGETSEKSYGYKSRLF